MGHFLVAAALGTGPWAQAVDAAIQEYYGTCDASAAVALDANHFVVASDEDSRLRVYAATKPGPPVGSFDLSAFLELDTEHPETDLEGAARVGDRIYWITSHGRSASGKRRESRGRFFATRLRFDQGRAVLEVEGRPYKSLLDDLRAESSLRKYNLKAAAKLAPKDPGALNIEGLCAAPQGRLLIGFRNPIPGGRALLAPLLNPDEMLAGHRARFGESIELDLGGLGIRDICLVKDRHLIVAGPYDGRKGGRLFWWPGGAAEPVPLSQAGLADLNPETAVFYPGQPATRFQLISDDGTREIDGCKCKELKDESKKRFRAVWLDLPENR